MISWPQRSHELRGFRYCAQARPEFEGVRFRLFRFRLRFDDQLSQLGSVADRIVFRLVQLIDKNMQSRGNLSSYSGVNVLVDRGLAPVSRLDKTERTVKNEARPLPDGVAGADAAAASFSSVVSLPIKRGPS